jgi:hypothetical protein
MKTNEKFYLGDAVYGVFDDWDVLHLTTEDGISTTNRIVLEQYVSKALVRALTERFGREALINSIPYPASWCYECSKDNCVCDNMRDNNELPG